MMKSTIGWDTKAFFSSPPLSSLEVLPVFLSNVADIVREEKGGSKPMTDPVVWYIW